jgi:monoamine oxidase
VGSKVHVGMRIDGKPCERTADEVILVVPPSVWNNISFKDPALATRLRGAPKLGSNVKYLMRLSERFWEDYSSSPTLTEDGPVDLTGPIHGLAERTVDGGSLLLPARCGGH